MSDITDTGSTRANPAWSVLWYLIALIGFGVIILAPVSLTWDAGKNFFGFNNPVVEYSKTGVFVTFEDPFGKSDTTYAADFITGNKKLRVSYSEYITFEKKCDCVTEVKDSNGRYVERSANSYSNGKVFTNYKNTEQEEVLLTPLLQDVLDDAREQIREMDARFPQ